MNPSAKSLLQKLVPVLLIGLVTAFGLGVFVGTNYRIANLPSLPPVGVRNAELKPAEVDASILWDAWRLVEARYADREDIDRQKLLYGAVRGLVKSLGDPYTVFFDPPEAKQFSDEVKGSFEGIGAEIGIRDGVLKVISPLEGSPAKRAGLLPGDAILKIDGAATVDISLDEAVRKIRGPKDTAVKLTIGREGEPEPREIAVVREQIVVPNLAWRTVEPEIAYVQLFHFTEQAGTDFRKIANELLKADAKRIILDLRSNPGGFLEVAQSIAGWFLERGALVVTEDFGDGKQNSYRAQGPDKLKGLPVVILVNEGSASASEILAGALRDNRGAKLIGAKTFGKGSVQQLEQLRDGSSIKITVAKWLTPKGQNLNKSGLEPDIVIERTPKDIEANRDPQLDKAVEVVKGL
ncbi:S41 family peptidase [Candidatus Parcubacteria bacterium]|nr:S41 family peptidase [Candidatus Parcubacteria bacterium]